MGIAKQVLLFGNSDESFTEKYTGKVDAPIYEPSHARPHLLFCCDETKTRTLIREIEASGLPNDEKAFLRAAAWRHAVFHYERIADYYAHATPEMQRFMEASALVIIDFGAAIEQGFVGLCNDIRTQYMEEYRGDVEPTA